MAVHKKFPKRKLRFHFHVSPAEPAQRAMRELAQHYRHAESPADADVIVSVGGDGTTLNALQDAIKYKKPVFGLNLGFTGFLQNLHKEGEDLEARIRAAEAVALSPLAVEAEAVDGSIHRAFAINEIHVCNRNRAEGVYMRVDMDGHERVPHLGADGLIISTAIGSTGYNKSARGPILPLGDGLLAFTPNNAFQPDRLRASVIRACPVVIHVKDPGIRIADLYADNKVICQKLKKVSVRMDPDNRYALLFDRGYGLNEKIMRSQFLTPEVV